MTGEKYSKKKKKKEKKGTQRAEEVKKCSLKKNSGQKKATAHLENGPNSPSPSLQGSPMKLNA